MASEDGYSLAVKQGLIDELPLDLGDPEVLAARVDQASALTDHYQVDVSPLTDNEVQAMADGLPTMTADEKMTLASTLSPAPSVWKQIAGKNAGAFAMAGATGDPAVMKGIFKGAELIATKQVKSPASKDFSVIANDYLGIAGEVYGVNDRKDVLAAALSHYAFTSSDKQEFNEDEFEASLEAVTGGIANVNGRKLELPRGVDADDFDDFIDEMQPETVELLGGLKYWGGDSSKKIQDAEIVSEGDGTYSVMIDGLSQLNNKGEPFTFKYTEELKLQNELFQALSQESRTIGIGKGTVSTRVERLKGELDAIRQ
jgi:hypothetical protein